MKNHKLVRLGVVLTLFGLLGGAHASGEQALSADEIMRRYQKAFFYQGETLSARIKMTLTTADGKERFRDMTMMRVNMPNGEDQRYFIAFHAPSDVQGMTFLVYKYPNKEDDRWLFIPAINLVQRIAARDASSSFVGSDFTYEDVSGRDLDADAHKILKEEDLGGKPCFVMESVPKEKAAHKKKLSWIDKNTFLPVKEEYYDVQDQLFKVFTADAVEDVGGVPTAVKRTMKNVKSGHQTVVDFSQTRYHLPFKSEDFNERAMRNPPKEWIK